MLMQIQAMLVDECGDPISDRNVTLISSRGGLDTMASSGAINNQYFFTVRSGTVGASQFTASAGRDYDGDSTTITFPLSTPPTGNFVCVNGQPDVSVNPNSVLIAYANPLQPSLNRRLIYLNVAWVGPALPPNDLVVEKVTFGNSANTIWQVAGGSPLPLTINRMDWTSINRSVVPGTSRALQVFFNQPITSAPGPYRVLAGWDNGIGGSVCYSSSVDVP